MYIPGIVIFLVGSGQVQQGGGLLGKSGSVPGTVVSCDHVVRKDRKDRDVYNYYNVLVEFVNPVSGRRERQAVKSPTEYAASQEVRLLGAGTQQLRIGGVEEDLRGIKHPCSDSGVSLEMVDGGTLEDFLITGIDIQRAWSPIFMRLEDRGRVRPDLPKPPVGTLRRVVIEHVTGCDNGPRGSYMTGVPEKCIEDVVLHDIHLTQHPSVKPVTTSADFDEMRAIYPDAHMIDDIGDAPAYALWARHIRKLHLRDYEVQPTAADPRPSFLFEDAEYTQA